MKKLLLFLMMLAFALPPAIAGEKTIVINRNEGIYDDGTGVYYCTRDGITMTFSDGLDNINYLVERSNKIFEINSTNFVIKKITFKCLDNTTADNLDCFYWGPSTMDECTKSPYVPTGTYTSSGYIGTWVGGSTPSKSVKFETQGKPIRFGSVEITIDKEFGDIYEKVTDNSQLKADSTYVLVSQYASKALGKEDYYSTTENLMCFTSTPVTLLDNNNKVKVTDEVQLMKLVSSGNSSRPWYIKVGDNYMRRRSSLSGSSSGAAYGQGYNLHSASSVTSYEQYFRVSISVTGNTNQNALIKFDHNTSETSGGKTFAIRHYNGGNLFRDMDYSDNNQYASNQRVYLYKPARSYEVTTECIPSNGGYITLGGGVLTDDQGKNWSQQYDNVTFFVGPTGGYGISNVTITDLNTRETTILDPVNTSDFGNDYSFEMPANDVKITANFLQPYDIHTVINPNGDSGSFEFIDGYTDFNGQPKSNEGKTVTFKPVAADGYSFTSVTGIDDVTGQPLNITLDADGNYSFEMPGNSVTLTANFDLIPYFVITTECQPSDAGRIDVYDGIAMVDNAMTAAPGNVVTFWVEHYNENVIQSVTVIREGVTEPVALNALDGNQYGRRYSFTMPTGNVHIVATFEPYYGLYLLGTSMGRTSWCPSGPKFTFDATNNEYYLDVYFKGGNDDAGVDQAYGYFSFAQTVTNFDWTNRNDNSSDWSGVSGRLAATSNNYPVDGNSSEVYLSGNANETSNFDNAFKIPAGVYRIIVNRAKNQMRIVETPLHLTFDPESGTIVPQGKVVTIDSDLEDVVHAIASSYEMTEDSQKFRNTTDDIDNNPTWVSDDNVGENGAQATINQDGTTVHAEAWIGYIVVPGSATYNFADYDITSICYPDNAGSITVAGTAQEGATVTFTVGTNEGYTLSSVVVVKSNDPTGEPIVPTDNGDGTYTFTMPADDVVIMANFSEAIQYYTATAHWYPQAGGCIWLNGSNGYDQVVSFTEGSTVEFSVDTDPHYRLTEVVVTNTMYAELCYPELDENNMYTFEMPAQNVYIMAVFEPLFDITKQVTPDGAGVITAPERSAYNETVNFSVEPNHGYILNSVTVTKDGNHQTVTVTDNGDGNYSFTMPEADVTVTADFTRVYDINTVCNPPEGGSIVVAGDADSSVSGSEIEFNVNVNSNDGYALSSVVVTDAAGETIDCNFNNGTYSFTMPESDVTITATFGVGYHVATVVDPEYSAQCNVYWSAYPDRNIFAENTPMTVEVTPELGYVVDRITLTNNTTEQVTELSLDPNNPNMTNFVMPNSDVTVTVYLNTTSLIFRLVTQVEQIIEGKTYTFVSQQYDKVLNRIIPNATSNRYSSTDIVEWAAPNKSLVRLDPNAAFFKAEDVGELVHNYGDNTIRSAYFKTIGGYLGFEDLTAPDDDVVNGCLTLCASKDDVKPIFTRIISNSATRSRNRAESVLDYGDGVDPAETDYHVTNQSRVIDTNPNGEFIMSNRVPYYVWLYKLAEPYNISTEVYDADAAAAGCNLTIEQTFGVLGTTALDGVTVTITPESVGGYVLDEIKYYTINGSSGKTLDKNLGGSYSFTMPVGDVTVKAIFKKGDYYNITTECYPPEGGVINVQPKAVKNETVYFSVTPNPGYAFDNELDGWPLKFYIRNENDEFEEFEPENLQYLNINNGTMRFDMPDADVKIVAFFETGYTVTTVVNPPEGGHFRTSSDESIGFVNTFAEGSNVYVDLWPNKNPNYDVKSVVLTYTIDGEQHVEELEGEPGGPGYPMNLEGWMLYYFEMPAAHVTVTAELELNSPLSYVECPIGDNKYAPLCDDHVIVTDNLIGVWAVKNLLWAKDQSPQVSNDEVKRPDGTIDYLRQNFKLQKKPWDQSNWVILDFSKTEGWTGSESDYIEVEKYVDHQIKGGSIHGIYSCDGDDYKGKNKIILDEMPVVITPEDPNSLGYPGYLADPREQDPNYDYMYNHYIPANFMENNIGGRFGGAGENGVIPENEDYQDLRMFFMNPKDQEVAQVWAVWYGNMKFPGYDNWHNEVMMNGDVFKIYERSIVSDGENEVSYNLYDFKGAFYVPSWKYNRLSSDRNHYGKPYASGDNEGLVKNNEYLFHVAIMTKGSEYMIVSKAPKRADGPVVQEDSKPWDHYEVYPLDLEPSSSIVTAVREIAAPSSTEIESIRYYNVMGQESKTPFDGINIEVIRYKDGSMISNKIYR